MFNQHGPRRVGDLASILVSGQRTFETSDLVEVTGVTGYVQHMNVRTTILMTPEGNVVQIPNASVIKEQARQVQPLNDEENLLTIPSGAPPADEKAKNHGDNGNEPGR
jgi:hypothetical protein